MMNESKIKKCLFYEASGILKYSIVEGYGHRLVVEVEQDLADYYYSLIPLYFPKKKPAYKAHISVVRKEVPTKLDAWSKYEGQRVGFYYEPLVHFNGIYWFLDCYSLELEFVRHELGLWYKGKYTVPPLPFHKFFHITIGNVK